MLRYAEELTRTGRTSDQTFNALRPGLSERDIVELTFAVAIANMTNRFNDALRTDLEH